MLIEHFIIAIIVNNFSLAHLQIINFTLKLLVADRSRILRNPILFTFITVSCLEYFFYLFLWYFLERAINSDRLLDLTPPFKVHLCFLIGLNRIRAVIIFTFLVPNNASLIVPFQHHVVVLRILDVFVNLALKDGVICTLVVSVSTWLLVPLVEKLKRRGRHELLHSYSICIVKAYVSVQYSRPLGKFFLGITLIWRRILTFGHVSKPRTFFLVVLFRLSLVNLIFPWLILMLSIILTYFLENIDPVLRGFLGVSLSLSLTSICRVLLNAGILWHLLNNPWWVTVSLLRAVRRIYGVSDCERS